METRKQAQTEQHSLTGQTPAGFTGVTGIIHETIVTVDSVANLFSYRRSAGETIVVLPRTVSGQFNDLAKWLLGKNPWQGTLVADKSHYLETAYKCEDLDIFQKDPGMNWHDELNLIRDDMQKMQKAVGYRAELRVVRDKGYTPGTHLFHIDGGEYRPALQAADRVMCCYNAPTTEWIRKSDAIVLPARQGVRCFKKKAAAPAFRFGVGDIWRQACMGHGHEALIHRAVETGPDDPPRLLLVC